MYLQLNTKGQLPPVEHPMTEEYVISWENYDVYDSFEILDGRWMWKDLSHTDQRLRSIFLLLTKQVGQKGSVFPRCPFVLSGTKDDIRLMRKPDVSLRVKPTNDDRLSYTAPDLALDIVMPFQTFVEMQMRVLEYLDAGTQQVWLMGFEPAGVWVHLADYTTKFYRVGQTISVGELLPEVSVDVIDLFKMPL